MGEYFTRECSARAAFDAYESYRKDDPHALLALRGRRGINSMLKVLKFGGSSLADARQFAKVKSIVEADPARRVVIVSAPGKRFSGDHKITDLLYLCAAHIKYGVSCEDIFAMIRDRYNEIIAECGLHISLDKEFDALWDKMKNGISQG